MYDDVNILLPVIHFLIRLKLENKVYNLMRTETMTLSHIGRVCEVFHRNVILLTWAKTYVTR